MINLDPQVEARLKEVMASKNPEAVGEFIGGTIAKKLEREDWLQVVYAREEGTEFTAPNDIIGTTAMKAVRGTIPETFTVTRRKIRLEEERYVSSPSMDVVDLQRGDLAQAGDLINESKQGLADKINSDQYHLVVNACKHGDANFRVIKDDGTYQTDGVTPKHLIAIKREMDKIIAEVQDKTRSRKLNAFVGRRVLMADIPGNCGLTSENKSKYELSSTVLDTEYKGVPLITLNGGTDPQGNPFFPANEIFAVAAGAGSYSIPVDVLTAALPQRNFQLSWELLTERITALWYKNLIWRIFVIDVSTGKNGKFTGILRADRDEIILTVDKYVKGTTLAVDTLKVYSGVEANSPAFTATVDGSGRYITIKFNASLAANATYKVINTVGVLDIGDQAFVATTDAAPIGTFDV